MTHNLSPLLQRLREADGASRELDAELAKAVGLTQWRAPLTRSIDRARGLLYGRFPGWAYRVAECSVSDDAWVMPDYNDPEYGAALKAAYEVSFWEQAPVDVDRRPAGQPALALCQAIIEALVLIEQRGEPMPWTISALAVEEQADA